MEHWQFLIQRQGDRSWHPLESLNGEILEGRYRVLARSNRPNADVEVRVTYSSTQEVPPRRRIQKRSRRTNSEGLMAVLPFTYFQAGIWELQCSGDVMSDILGKSWQYSIYLQVLSQNEDGSAGGLGDEESTEPNLLGGIDTTVAGGLGDEESTEPNLLGGIDTSAAIELVIPAERSITITTQNTLNTTDLLDKTAEEIIIDQPVNPVWLKGETAEQILQNLIELALPGSESLSEDETFEDASVIPASPLLLLTLDQEIYVARWGQALTINGQVDFQEKVNSEGDTPYPESLYALELRIELRSPVRSQILIQRREALRNEVLPFTIRYAIDIPAECESKLLLADITLYGSLTDFGEVIVLANQSFTITADVTELLAIAAPAQPSTPNLLGEEAGLTPPAVREPEPSVSLDLALFNLVKSNKKDQPLVFEPSVNKSLPPLINLRSPNKSTDSRTLELPNFPPLSIKTMTEKQEGTGGAIVVVTETPKPEDILDNHDAIAPINLEELVIRNRPLLITSNSFPFLKPLKALPGGQEEVNKNMPDALEIPDIENIDVYKHTLGLVTGDAQSQDEHVNAVADAPTPELIDQPIVEVTTPPEFIDEVRDVTRNASLLNSELIIEGNAYSSPVIRKWLQSQGYILPEPDQGDDTQVPPRQTISKDQLPLPAPPPPPMENLKWPLVDVETAIATNAEMAKSEAIEISENTELVQPADTAVSLTDLKAGNEVPATTGSLRRQIPPLPPPRRPKKPPAWLAQEIVVDDTDIEPEIEVMTSNIFEQEEQPESDISSSQTMTAASNEPLPIPQLHIQEGELIAGNFVKIRVELPELPPQVVVKLWVEDYQTRWLLDGPHLLKNLQPNALGGLEVMTQLNVPFGCLEIRVEAIALNLVTQQESHKVTIVRAVIPPNLPSLSLDALFGI
jgi:hypothetical protein